MSYRVVSHYICFLLMLILLSGCISFSKKGGYYQDDGPPSNRQIARASNTPNAVPKQEPLSKTGNSPYTVFGKRYIPLKSANGYRAKGTASWYGKKFHGRRTSSGEVYDMYAMSAAHTVLPLPSYVRVTNLHNNRQVIVKVNDRGPFLHNRLIDLSYSAAVKLDMLGKGTAEVLVETVTSGEPYSNTSSSYPQNSNQQVSVIPPQVSVQADVYTEVGKNGYVIQVGAFANEQNALSFKLRIQDIGFDNVFIRRIVTNSQRVLYRVQLGVGSRHQIQVIQQKLAELGFDSNLVHQ